MAVASNSIPAARDFRISNDCKKIGRGLQGAGGSGRVEFTGNRRFAPPDGFLDCPEQTEEQEKSARNGYGKPAPRTQLCCYQGEEKSQNRGHDHLVPGDWREPSGEPEDGGAENDNVAERKDTANVAESAQMEASLRKSTGAKAQFILDLYGPAKARALIRTRSELRKET